MVHVRPAAGDVFVGGISIDAPGNGGVTAERGNVVTLSDVAVVGGTVRVLGGNFDLDDENGATLNLNNSIVRESGGPGAWIGRGYYYGAGRLVARHTRIEENHGSGVLVEGGYDEQEMDAAIARSSSQHAGSR